MSKRNKSQSPQSGREALRQRQQAQAAADKRMKTTIRVAWGIGVAVIAVMIGVIVWSFATARSGTPGVVAADGVTAPATATDSGAVLIGQADAPVTLSVYADFMCPFCGQFERANGDDIITAMEAGTAKLELHPMAFLDQQSGGTKFSTRAANAFVTIADSDPEAALRFYQLVYANQPEEGSSGLTDQQLVDLAQQAGASAEVTASFVKQTFVPWVQKITQQAFDSGITGTPTVKINGEQFTGEIYTAGPLAAAIAQAANA